MKGKKMPAKQSKEKQDSRKQLSPLRRFYLAGIPASGGFYYMRGSGDMKNIYQPSSKLSSPQRVWEEVRD